MLRSRSNTRQNHLKLARQIVEIVLERGVQEGQHLPETVLSEACGVSRTPIRSALKILENNDIVQASRRRRVLSELAAGEDRGRWCGAA